MSLHYLNVHLLATLFEGTNSFEFRGTGDKKSAANDSPRF